MHRQALVLILSILLCGTASAKVPDTSQVAKIYFEGRFRGSGVMLGPYLLTAWHVVEGVDRNKIRAQVRGRLYRGHSWVAWPQFDFAYCKIGGLRAGGTPTQLANRSPRVGETIWICANGGGLDKGLRKGVVSKVGRIWFYSDAMAHPGDSGGPVFDDRGRLLGLVVAKIPGGLGDWSYSVILRLDRAFGEMKNRKWKSKGLDSTVMPGSAKTQLPWVLYDWAGSVLL